MSDDEISDEEDMNLGHYEGGRNEQEQRHGFGKAYFPNGDNYEGMYENGKRHGKGIYKFSIGSYYDGNYLWNKRDGSGIFIYPDGSKYQGNWSEDTRHGVGTYHYINGDIYEGEWFRNKRNGKGVYIQIAANTTIKGTWHEGKLNGPCKITYGHYTFEGSYVEDIIKGKGKFTFPTKGIEVNGVYNVLTTEEETIPEEGSSIRKHLSVWTTNAMVPIHDQQL